MRDKVREFFGQLGMTIMIAAIIMSFIGGLAGFWTLVIAAFKFGK